MPNLKQFKTHEEYLDWYRIYREKKRTKIRKYNREYNKKYRKKNGYYNEHKWFKQNPIKRRAEWLAYYALKISRIKRKSCEICNKKAVMHHEDYLKPLEVKWLCRLHHKHLHLGKINLSTLAVACSFKI